MDLKILALTAITLFTAQSTYASEEKLEEKNMELFDAIVNSDTPRVKRLLTENHLDVNTINIENADPLLLIAAWQKDKAIVRLLLDVGADTNKKNRDGDTALQRAAYSGDRDIFRWLLESGADIEAQNKAGETAFHIAAQFGHIGIINLLLKYKANIKAQDYQGITPAMCARTSGNKDIACILEAIVKQ